MDEHLGIVGNPGLSQKIECSNGAVGTRLTARHECSHLGEATFIDDAFHRLIDRGIDDHNDVSHLRGVLKCLKGPCNHRTVIHGNQLLGVLRIEARAETSGKDYGDDRDCRR